MLNERVWSLSCSIVDEESARRREHPRHSWLPNILSHLHRVNCRTRCFSTTQTTRVCWLLFVPWSVLVRLGCWPVNVPRHRTEARIYYWVLNTQSNWTLDIHTTLNPSNTPPFKHTKTTYIHTTYLPIYLTAKTRANFPPGDSQLGMTCLASTGFPAVPCISSFPCKFLPCLTYILHPFLNRLPSKYTIYGYIYICIYNFVILLNC